MTGPHVSDAIGVIILINDDLRVCSTTAKLIASNNALATMTAPPPPPEASTASCFRFEARFAHLPEFRLTHFCWGVGRSIAPHPTYACSEHRRKSRCDFEGLEKFRKRLFKAESTGSIPVGATKPSPLHLSAAANSGSFSACPLRR
jgi:hypothetical protein